MPRRQWDKSRAGDPETASARIPAFWRFPRQGGRPQRGGAGSRNHPWPQPRLRDRPLLRCFGHSHRHVYISGRRLGTRLHMNIGLEQSAATQRQSPFCTASRGYLCAHAPLWPCKTTKCTDFVDTGAYHPGVRSHSRVHGRPKGVCRHIARNARARTGPPRLISIVTHDDSALQIAA